MLYAQKIGLIECNPTMCNTCIFVEFKIGQTFDPTNRTQDDKSLQYQKLFSGIFIHIYILGKFKSNREGGMNHTPPLSPSRNKVKKWNPQSCSCRLGKTSLQNVGCWIKLKQIEIENVGWRIKLKRLILHNGTNLLFLYTALIGTFIWFIYFLICLVKLISTCDEFALLM